MTPLAPCVATRNGSSGGDAGASPSAVCILIGNVFLLVGEQRRSSMMAAVWLPSRG